jgi:alpha-beta hydrolase superfamily lysophospholipase
MTALTFRRLFTAFAGCGIAGCLAIGWIGSGKFVIPTRRPLEPRHLATLQSPADFGFEIEAFDVALPHERGIVLKAMLLTPAAHPGKAEKSRRMRQRLIEAGHALPPWGGCHGTVVMLHGRGGIKEDAFPVAERFVAAGFRCLIYDARAHGESGGEFCTYGARETADVSSVVDTARRRFGGREIGPLVAFGISQGAAVTLQALPGENRLRAAVVVAPFAELEPVADRAVENVISPMMPAFLTTMVTMLGGWRADFSPGSIRPIDFAALISVPVMVAHGGRDAVIPYDDGRRIFEILPVEEKRWRPVPDGTHRDVLSKGGDDLYQEMIEFFLTALSQVPPPGAPF